MCGNASLCVCACQRLYAHYQCVCVCAQACVCLRACTSMGMNAGAVHGWANWAIVRSTIMKLCKSAPNNFLKNHQLALLAGFFYYHAIAKIAWYISAFISNCWRFCDLPRRAGVRGRTPQAVIVGSPVCECLRVYSLQ